MVNEKFDLKKLKAEAATEEAAPVRPNIEWPTGLHRRVKAAAATSGKTLQQWVIDELSAKLNYKP